MSAGANLRYTIQIVVTGQEAPQVVAERIRAMNQEVQSFGQQVAGQLGQSGQQVNIYAQQTEQGLRKVVTVTNQTGGAFRQAGTSLADFGNAILRFSSIAHQILSLYTQWTVWQIRQIQYQNQYRDAILREQRLLRDLIVIDKEHGLVLMQNVKLYEQLYKTQRAGMGNFDDVRKATNALSVAMNLYGTESDAAHEKLWEFQGALAEWGKGILQMAPQADKLGLQETINAIIDTLTKQVSTGTFAGWEQLAQQTGWNDQWAMKYGRLGAYGETTENLIAGTTDALKQEIASVIPIQEQISRNTADWTSQMEAAVYDIYTAADKLKKASDELGWLIGATIVQVVGIVTQALMTLSTLGIFAGGGGMALGLGSAAAATTGAVAGGSAGIGVGSVLAPAGATIGVGLAAKAPLMAAGALGGGYTASALAGGSLAGASFTEALAYTKLGGAAIWGKAAADTFLATAFQSGSLGEAIFSPMAGGLGVGGLAGIAAPIAIAGIGMWKLGQAKGEHEEQARKTATSTVFSGMGAYDIANQLGKTEDGLRKLGDVFLDFSQVADTTDAKLRDTIIASAKELGYVLDQSQAQAYVDRLRDVLSTMSTQEFAQKTGMKVEGGTQVPGYQFGTLYQWQGISGYAQEYQGRVKQAEELLSPTKTVVTQKEQRTGVTSQTPGAVYQRGFGLQPGAWYVPEKTETVQKTAAEMKADTEKYNLAMLQIEYETRLGKEPAAGTTVTQWSTPHVQKETEQDVAWTGMVAGQMGRGWRTPLATTESAEHAAWIADKNRLDEWKAQMEAVIKGTATATTTAKTTAPSTTGTAVTSTGGQTWGIADQTITQGTNILEQMQAIALGPGTEQEKSKQMRVLYDQYMSAAYPQSWQATNTALYQQLFPSISGSVTGTTQGTAGVPFVQLTPTSIDPLKSSMDTLNTSINGLNKTLGGTVSAPKVSGTTTPSERLGIRVAGGMVPRTGDYRLEAGEVVTPEAETTMGNIEYPPKLSAAFDKMANQLNDFLLKGGNYDAMLARLSKSSQGLGLRGISSSSITGVKTPAGGVVGASQVGLEEILRKNNIPLDSSVARALTQALGVAMGTIKATKEGAVMPTAAISGLVEAIPVEARATETGRRGMKAASEIGKMLIDTYTAPIETGSRPRLGVRQAGGMVAQTGVYKLEAGETVMPEISVAMGGLGGSPSEQEKYAKVKEFPLPPAPVSVPAGAGKPSHVEYNFGDINISVEQVNSEQDIRTIAYRLRRYIQQETSRSVY